MASVIRGNDNFDSASVGSTTYGDVGTYTSGRPNNKTTYNPGDTASGIVPIGWSTGATGDRENGQNDVGDFQQGTVHSTLSGTWRSMNGAKGNTSTSIYGQSHTGIWVRIS